MKNLLSAIAKEGGMKKMFLCSILFSLMMCGMAHATLTTIGTAGYDSDGSGTIDPGERYKLIWDNDNNGNSVVWLDYTKDSNYWDKQASWASTLNEDGVLDITLYDGYTVDWGGASWRLPATMDGDYATVDDDYERWGLNFGYDGTTVAGWNISSSEMGHLFYEELGNLGTRDTSGHRVSSGYGLIETGDFDNLSGDVYGGQYWSDTAQGEYGWFWGFEMFTGEQGSTNWNSNKSAIALRNGQVSVVPIPGAILLLGSGLLGMAAAGRKKGN